MQSLTRHNLIILLGCAGAIAASCLALHGGGGRQTSRSFVPAAARSAPRTMHPTRAALLPLSADEQSWLSRQVPAPTRGRLTPSLCVHLMRVHGVGTTVLFEGTSHPLPLLDILLNDDLATQYFGAPTLLKTRYGACFALSSGDGEGGEFHRDQSLAALAELGVPLSHAVVVDGERLAVHDILNDSLAQFHLDQKELAWSADAYALYLPPASDWLNRFNEKYSFDALATHLLERPVNEASCFGMHLISSITTLARVDNDKKILSASVRSAVPSVGRWCRHDRGDADG